MKVSERIKQLLAEGKQVKEINEVLKAENFTTNYNTIAVLICRLRKKMKA